MSLWNFPRPTPTAKRFLREQQQEEEKEEEGVRRKVERARRQTRCSNQRILYFRQVAVKPEDVFPLVDDGDDDGSLSEDSDVEGQQRAPQQVSDNFGAWEQFSR